MFYVEMILTLYICKIQREEILKFQLTGKNMEEALHLHDEGNTYTYVPECNQKKDLQAPLRDVLNI